MLLELRKQLDLKNKNLRKKSGKLKQLQDLKLRQSKNVKSGVTNIANRKNLLGDTIIKKLRTLLWKIKLNKNQVILGEIYLLANLENIYGEDFKSNELRIKRENHIPRIKPFSLCSMPRRNGKSFIGAWFVSCSLVTMAGFRSLVFAPALRQCKYFMKEIQKSFKYYNQLDIKFTYLVRNTLNLEILTECGDINTFSCLPCRADTTRGAGANFIIVDEMSFVPEDFILQVLLPLLQVEKTTFIGISTHNGEDSHFYKYIKLHNPDDPNSPIHIFQFFTACADCRKKGLAAYCKHNEKDLPEWISIDRKTKVLQMYRDIGGGDIGDQELSGVVKQKARNAFNHHHIDLLFLKLSIVPDSFFFQAPTMLFSSIDPTQGTASDLAISSGVYENGVFVYCGMESISGFESDHTFPLVVKHYRELRNNELFKNAHLYVWIEGNMPWNSNDLKKLLLRNLKNVNIMDASALDNAATILGNKKCDGRVGILSTNESKVHMWEVFKDHLALGRLKFWDKFICVHHPSPSLAHKTSRDAVRDLAKQQLKYFKVQVNRSLNPMFQRDKIALSGKDTSGTRKDDIAGSMQMVVDWTNLYIINKNMKKESNYLDIIP